MIKHNNVHNCVHVGRLKYAITAVPKSIPISILFYFIFLLKHFETMFLKIFITSNTSI